MWQVHRGRMALILAGAMLINLSGCAHRREAKMKRRMGEIPEKYKNDGAPQAGDVAYLFKLKTVEGDRTVDISRAVGDRPVALFFGSYT